MKTLNLLIVISILIISAEDIFTQDVITFDDQKWDSDQSLPSNFTVDNFSFSSNKNFYTNYGYNLDVNNTSIYFVFQNPAVDQFTIKTINNELVNLNSISVYQVSEVSTDNLTIEGWNNESKKYSLKFSGIKLWQTLPINFDNINKVIFKLEKFGNGGIPDFNFDNFTFNKMTVPVELTIFKAKVELEKIILEWQTATELNNFGFDIERKDSLIDWQKIGFLKGHGNSTIPNEYSFSDNSIKECDKYKYRLKQKDYNGEFKYYPELEVSINQLPGYYKLSQNYPNPFNPSTTINYQIPKAGNVTIKVYDILGNEVVSLVNENKVIGNYSVTFNGENLPSGIYIYKLISNGFVFINKMMLIK
jgi:hypothetical protein